jgi:hypothetical protein
MVNYADAYGIHSLAAAIIFLVIYTPLVPFYVWKSVKSRTFVYYMLTLFCVIRFVAFLLRAILAGSDSAGSKLDLLIAEQVIYNVGFFGVLYSTYTLVLDRQLVAGIEVHNPLQIITSNRHIIQIVMTAAVVLGIIGAIDVSSSNLSSQATGRTLRTASTAIFLALVVLLAIHLTFIIIEMQGIKQHAGENRSFGRINGMYILIIIVLLLMVREVFYIATIQKPKVQTNEALFYPLAALPEVLVVFLFAIPGLVPPKSELPLNGDTGIIIIDLINRIREMRRE